VGLQHRAGSRTWSLAIRAPRGFDRCATYIGVDVFFVLSGFLK
jgi:peptidoglycan/LPS O-acetylase OafA/YrhL